MDERDGEALVPVSLDLRLGDRLGDGSSFSSSAAVPADLRLDNRFGDGFRGDTSILLDSTGF